MLLQFAMSHPNFHGEVQRVMALLRDDDWLGSTTPFGVYYEMIELLSTKITAFLANLAVKTC